MKRYLHAYLVFSLILLTGCGAGGDDQPQPTPTPTPGGEWKPAVDGCEVVYDVTTSDVSTRSGGEAVSSATFADGTHSFRIWTWMTDGSGTVPMTSDHNTTPLFNIPVSYSAESDSWEPSLSTYGTFYWPRPQYRLDCCAVYPETAAFTMADDASSKTITYNPFDGNTDLMYASYSGQRSSRDNSETSRAVPLRFYHAMSQILFYGKLSDEFVARGWSVEITNITIHNVNRAGTFTFANEISKYGTVEALVFTPTENRGDYTLDLNTNGSSVALNSGTDTRLTSATKVLMVLPQSLTAWDRSAETAATTSKGYVSVTLNVKSGSSTIQNGVTLYTPFASVGSGWEAGNAYKYTLTIGSVIDVAASIVPWSVETITPDPIYQN